jgi:AcrR family transcriptional regulator
MRADALRNRNRILEAAEEIFAREGISVPVDAVAEAAGVGVGTLYRHFPTKEALFEAIVYTRLCELVEATKVGEDVDPGEAFFAFLDKMADQITLKHDLFDALAAAGVDVKSKCGELVHELELGIEALRNRAVAAGVVRDDIGAHEVMGLVIGACTAAEHSGMDLGSGQMLRVVYDGLRTRP